jgi:non-ribosomal peptide synthase protein (TIGR01720 family)
MSDDGAFTTRTGFEVAVIGMSCRVPGAGNVEQFWWNLRNGVEAISTFTDEEVLAAGVDSQVLGEPNFVRAGGVLQDIEMFDASFFGCSPREAEILDPQHRFFLECAWEALEHAGYSTAACAESVGVFAGVGLSSYLRNIYSEREFARMADAMQLVLGNDKDYLATRVSYKLNLKGPSVTVQSACSTSLLAAHLASQSLLSGACDMALAGGVTISVPQKTGYFYREGGIASPDGHTRAFDARARGCVGGSGVGVVVLKRLEDALASSDLIYAVIKGSAANNDGSQKVGFTAPSVEGQAEVIRTALDVADVAPETISYVETHGTATPLGDPVEIAALTQAFRERTQKKGFCAIGSVKTNVGHLDTAAGVTGLIKTVLALRHQELPPSLHFQTPNPQIDFANSPFYVNAELSEWRAAGHARRAGVSSFGIGGTNVHMILEEAPPTPPTGASRLWQLMPLSAKTESALEAATSNLAEHLRKHPALEAADVAYTLQVGRAPLGHRRLILCGSLEEATAALESGDPESAMTNHADLTEQPVVFMFPGQGAQTVNMGSELYRTEPAFRESFDLCCELLEPRLGLDLRDVLYPPEGADDAEAAGRLRQTLFAQPALFAVGYALAQLWQEWGVRPQAMIGHSIGEYLAACLAGVFTLEEALRLVATRARLMQQLPAGAMLAVSLPESEVSPLLNGTALSLAAVNGPSLCVISGSPDAAADLSRRLDERGLDYRPLHTSHAFHSAMMEPVLEPFREHVRGLKLNPPRLRYLSNVTGTWITEDQATDPDYWVTHLRQTVRFADGLSELFREGNQLLLELGPGDTLSTLALRHPTRADGLLALPSLRRPRDSHSDVFQLLSALGQLWLRGVEVDWHGFHAREQRRRLPLPTYPFERKRYWIEHRPGAGDGGARQAAPLKKPDIADWFYVPVWKQSVAPNCLRPAARTPCEPRWLLFADECGLGRRIARRLEGEGAEVVTVRPGAEFERAGEGEYVVNPGRREDYDALVECLERTGSVPAMIVHSWGVAPQPRPSAGAVSWEEEQESGFYSLLFLAQALGGHVLARTLGTRDEKDSFHLTVVTNGLHKITGCEQLSPERAIVAGPCRVIPQEYPNFTCRSIDLALDSSEAAADPNLVDQLLAELKTASAPQLVAYRGQARWVQAFEPVRLDGPASPPPRLRERGVYLITGGLGGVGLEVAEYLARNARARLVLLNRTSFPAGQEWEAWLSNHPEQDATSIKIRRLQALERLGAEVLTLRADVTVREELEAALMQAARRFGLINGVVHAAGLPPESSIQRSTPEMFARVLGPKLQGTRLLAEVFKDAGLDFLLLCSSLRSLTGGAGAAAYCAANTFLDAFAHAHHSPLGTAVTAVNWDGWLGVGMSLDAARARPGAEQSGTGMSAEEGAAALHRVLWSALPQVVISVRDLEAVLEQERDLTALDALEQLATSRPAASAHPRPALENDYVAPSNQMEETLARIWQELLGVEKVGVNDNFFELGGDSVISIQIIARANQAGLRLTPKQVFEHQTVAALAAAATAETRADIAPEQEHSATGPVPLSPIQHWFFEQRFHNPNHFNQAVLLEVRRRLEYDLLRPTVRELLRHHDALRLRFTREGDAWQQVCAGLEEDSPCRRVDLSAVARAEQPAAIEATAAEMQSGLDLSGGPLLRVVLFDLGDGQPQRLLIVIHHLATDAVSWRILLEDFETVYRQLSRGEEIRLPARTTSFKRWAERLVEYARSEDLSEELGLWLAAPRARSVSLPLDHPAGANTAASARSVEVSLDEEQTVALLQGLPRTARVQAHEALLTALVKTFSKWTGSPSLLIDLEGHGREPLFSDVDLSRTVGWFTPLFPVLLDMGGAAGVEEELARVRQQLRAIPLGGIGYGLLRYMNPDREIAERLRALPQAEVSFLYLGQFDQMLPDASPFALAHESSGPHCGPEEERGHTLELVAKVIKGRLQVTWIYSENLHRTETIEARARELVEALRSIIARSPEKKSFAASDFAAFGWSQEDVDGIIAELDQV